MASSMLHCDHVVHNIAVQVVVPTAMLTYSVTALVLF